MPGDDVTIGAARAGDMDAIVGTLVAAWDGRMARYVKTIDRGSS